MRLTTEEIILVTDALRHHARRYAELGAQTYGKPAYRANQRRLAHKYESLAKAFNNHREVNLTLPLDPQ